MFSAEQIAFTLEMLYNATMANSFNTILTQIMLNDVDPDIVLKYNGLVATFLHGSEDIQLTDLFDFIGKLELTPDTRSIVDYHIWLLKRQPTDHRPVKTV